MFRTLLFLFVIAVTGTAAFHLRDATRTHQEQGTLVSGDHVLAGEESPSPGFTNSRSVKKKTNTFIPLSATQVSDIKRKSQNAPAIWATYAAKMMCTAHFHSQRSPDAILDYDLLIYKEAFETFGRMQQPPFSFENFTNYTIGERSLSWTVCCTEDSAFCWKKCHTVAYHYLPDFGCIRTEGSSFTTGGRSPLPISSFKMEATATTTSPAELASKPLAIPRKLSWVPEPKPKPSDILSLDALMERLMDNGTYATILYKEGQGIVREHYAEALGITNETALYGWSMTKTLGALMLGLRHASHDMDLNKVVELDGISATDLEKRKMTPNNLLRMHVQNPLLENYFLGPQADNAAFLDMFGADDASSFAVLQPKLTCPNLENLPPYALYSSGSVMILSHAIRASFEGDGGDEAYWSFLRKRIFDPIGMSSKAIVEPDPSGNLFLSSLGWGTAEDWLRLGMLLLQDGAWKGEDGKWKQVLPEGWVDQMRKRNVCFTPPNPEADPTCTPGYQADIGNQYGGGVWLGCTTGKPSNDYCGETHPWGNDQVSMEGHDGQRVVVNFKTRTVFVRLGFTDYGAITKLSSVPIPSPNPEEVWNDIIKFYLNENAMPEPNKPCVPLYAGE